MLKKLASDGYLAYQARGEAKLTERGLSVAVRVMRRHRLAECFLTTILGMPWDEVNEEACRLEHAISARVEERLVAVLGDPKFCPHGLPIPSADLSEPERVDLKLSDLAVGGSARIMDVAEDVPEMLRFLDEIGVRPGAVVDVVARGPLGGPVTLSSPSGRHAISLELARLISVEPLETTLRSA
jgi:DtxR family Mn-dependent transcriptional regulator